MPDARQKLQELLRQLFQFDCADLDFGIYRIMNHKRAEIERFIEKDLLDAVTAELEQGALAQQAEAAARLEDATREVRESLAEDAISPDGDLAKEYRRTKAGKNYLELREQAAAYHARPEQETLIFNHLLAFFGRYYVDGDFISKRRYSRRERYAIPYNGEEVYLHWANKDQYYVKSGEHFTDYTFKSPGGVTVHFKLQAADVEQNNVKGEKRFFVPLVKQATWDGETREVVIPFEYRPLTEQEGIIYGTRDQQEKLIADAVEKLPPRFKQSTEALAALVTEHPKPYKDKLVSYLEHHLRLYTARNTSDFFIHKDLRGFLERELDFYLKNEVLNLEELLAGDDGRAEGWFQLMQVIRRIALRIIAFLAQIEDFQKRLWEKKKFVLSTEYCMTLDRVPEEFYPEIGKNEAQIEEWRRLFKIDEIVPNLFHKGGKPKKAGKNTAGLDVAFVKAHPTLVLNTRFFDQDFRDRLLASFDDLDEQTGGLLIHSENSQALNILTGRFRERVHCTYLDPPYNTNPETFLYKNDYQHSSWLAMMHERLALTAGLTAPDGVVCVAIDDAEAARLEEALDALYGRANSIGTIVVQSNPRGRTINTFFATCHDYCLVYARSADLVRVSGHDLTPEQAAAFNLTDEVSAYRLLPFRRSGGLSTPAERPNSYYPIYYSEKTGKISVEPLRGAVEILPLDSSGKKRVWRQTRPSLMEAVSRGDIVIKRNGDRYTVFMKDRIKTGRKPKTIWTDSRYDASTHGTVLVADILGDARLFSYPKSLFTVMDTLSVMTKSHPQAVILDFFAGSGTTGHAILNINAEDGGDRRYILVEMADYFDTVLKPRIEKVMFSREWRDGKPTSNEGHSHMFRYQRLESYEDALDNIAFDDAAGQQAFDLYRGDYLLRYMLDFETRDSETLLNVAKLESPFSYTLRIHRDGETREQPVDLPETFNYLIGLHVRTRRVYDDRGRRYLVYRGSNERSEVVVIWRDTTGWKKADLERDKRFVLEQKLTEGADEIFVNSDSFIPGAKSLDPVFKRRMAGEA